MRNLVTAMCPKCIEDWMALFTKRHFAVSKQAHKLALEAARGAWDEFHSTFPDYPTETLCNCEGYELDVVGLPTDFVDPNKEVS